MQHTLLTQLAVAHCGPCVHAWPAGAVAWQVAVATLQYGEVPHCASPVQDV